MKKKGIIAAVVVLCIGVACFFAASRLPPGERGACDLTSAQAGAGDRKSAAFKRAGMGLSDKPRFIGCWQGFPDMTPAPIEVFCHRI